MSTGTSGRPNANSSTQAAVLRPTPGSAVRYARASSTGSSAEEREVRRVRQRAQDLLDPHGLLAVQAAGLDRRLDLLQRRVAHLLPGREARAQAQVGDVAVAVVGRLREHGEDQLLEPVAVRRRDRPAVDEPQPIAQRAHATRRGRRPARRAARWRAWALTGVSLRTAKCRERRAPPNSLMCRAARDRDMGACSGSGAWRGAPWSAPTGVNPSEVSECVQRCSLAVP